jgi:alkylation response protein AidB-like acyl-CoA dehydrogenase
MTERQGGSDVANGTETIAVKQPGNEDLYKLYGYKWFSSATDSDMTITLARIVDENMNVILKRKEILAEYQINSFLCFF